MDRVNFLKFLLFAISLMIGTACVPVRHMVRDATPVELKALNGYVADQIPIDYGSECKIRIKSQAINQSGRCSILLTHDNHMKFTLNNPFGAAVMISYMDRQIIQLLNRQDKTFFQAENNEKNRRTAFANLLDLTVDEFREIIWGRKITSHQNSLEFEYSDQQPAIIRKTTHNQKLLIRYLKWQELYGLTLPRIITMEDATHHISIRIALTHIRLGLTGEKGRQNILKGCELHL